MQVSVLDDTRIHVKTKGYNPRFHTWVKQIPSRERQWIPDDKAWWFHRKHLSMFAQVFPDVNLPVEAAGKAAQQLEVGTAPLTSDFYIPHLKREPYPFQRAGVEAIVGMDGRGICGDSMGLGKTVEGIGVVAHYADKRPAVIVCPMTVASVWEDHIKDWLDERTYGDTSSVIVKGKKPLEPYPKVSFYIIQWDLLAYHIDFLASVAKIVIFDEAHRAANGRSNRGEAATRLAHAAKVCLPLTGTPMRNGPKDIWNLLHMVAPRDWPNFFQFGKSYCNGHQKEIMQKGGKRRLVWDWSGSSRQAELAMKLQGYMVRRLKEQVLKELPEKYPPRKVVFQLKPAARKEYNRVLTETTEAIRQSQEENDGYIGGLALKQLTELRKLSAALIIDQVCEHIKDFIEDDKLIVFTHHRDIADQIYEQFKKVAVRVVGGMPQDERTEAMRAFQEDENVLLFVGNIDAAGEGLTLTRACTELFVELPWTPAQFDQCSDRAHRIGQTRGVTIQVAIAENTIYDHMWDVIVSKREVIDGIVDMKSVQMKIMRMLLRAEGSGASE